MRIAILGPESCGKSTMAQQLAERYGYKLVSEYAREYVEQLDRPYCYDDVVAIARQQIHHLEQTYAPGGADYEENVIFDTELIITKVWFLHSYGECPQWVEDAIKDYPINHYLLCYPDLPWVEDPTRENPHIRQELYEEYLAEIIRTGRPYTILRGTGEERMQPACKIIEQQTI